MCYFLTIGAKAPAHRLLALLEEQTQLQVAAGEEWSEIVAAFPGQDVVRCILHRGCSCGLLSPPGGEAAKRTQSDLARLFLSRGCRLALARAAREFGGVRLYLRGREHLSPRHPRRVEISHQELLSDPALPTNVLIEVRPPLRTVPD